MLTTDYFPTHTPTHTHPVSLPVADTRPRLRHRLGCRLLVLCALLRKQLVHCCDSARRSSSCFSLARHDRNVPNSDRDLDCDRATLHCSSPQDSRRRTTYWDCVVRPAHLVHMT